MSAVDIPDSRSGEAHSGASEGSENKRDSKMQLAKREQKSMLEAQL